MSAIGIFTGIIVYFLDMKTGGVLNSSDPELARKNYNFKNGIKPEEMQDSIN